MIILSLINFRINYSAATRYNLVIKICDITANKFVTDLFLNYHTEVNLRRRKYMLIIPFQEITIRNDVNYK